MLPAKAGILHLPSELIDCICAYQPTIIPPLRRSCRQLQVSTFDTFARHYFTRIDVLADDHSFKTLHEIAQHATISRYIKSIGVFRCADGHPDASIVLVGRSRSFGEQLSNVLKLLPSCSHLIPGIRCGSFLGRKSIFAVLQVEPFSSIDDVEKYGMLRDALFAVRQSKANIARIASEVAIDTALWANEMDASCEDQMLPTVTEFSGSTFSTFNFLYDLEERRPRKTHSCNLGDEEHSDEMGHETPTLQSFFHHMPNLSTLSLREDPRAFFDNVAIVYPIQLQNLIYHTRYSYPYEFKGFPREAHGLRRLVNLKTLTWVTEFPKEARIVDLMEEISHLPNLQEICFRWHTRLTFIKGRNMQIRLPVTTAVPCFDSHCGSKKHCDDTFEWRSSSPKTDLPAWKDRVHLKRLQPDIAEAIGWGSEVGSDFLLDEDEDDDDMDWDDDSDFEQFADGTLVFDDTTSNLNDYDIEY